MAIKDEIEYPLRLSHREKEWLYTKPFGKYDIDESQKSFRDFSTILYLINKYNPKAKSILELGSGPGWLSIFLNKMGFNVKGYDVSGPMIEVASKRIESEGLKGIKFEVLDIEDDFRPVDREKYDVVILYDILHHCQDDGKVVKNIGYYLKMGGIAILAEPNQSHSHDHDAQEAVERFGVTERGLSYKKIISLFRLNGFRLSYRYHASGQSFLPRNGTFIDTIKMIFYPFYARFVADKYRTRIWILAQK